MKAQMKVCLYVLIHLTLQICILDEINVTFIQHLHYKGRLLINIRFVSFYVEIM